MYKNIFDVYPLFDIEPVKGEGCYVTDKNGVEYLDLYGGHAVISIGHSHPTYVKNIQEQVAKIGFYSNSIQNPMQAELADKLAKLSGLSDYQLFLCNSGAEANENALKLASFHNGRKKVIAFDKGFHGRTSAAVNCTDNAKIIAPINDGFPVERIPFDSEEIFALLDAKDVTAVIIEPIQGIGGINMPSADYMKRVREACTATDTVLICDEVQSGYGRSGKFFAYQHFGIEADVIPMAKGMGNGFPIGGVFISPMFKASYGLLGTTFGGNHLACAAGISVLDVLAEEQLIENAASLGSFLMEELNKIEGLKSIKGRGLMIGVEFDFPAKEIRSALLFEHKIFTGSSANPNMLRLLPPLSMGKEEAIRFVEALKTCLSDKTVASAS